MFYCYNEKLQFPLTSDVEGELLNKSSNLYFDNYKVYTAIIDKYLQINNTLAKNITNIKKENIDEITITILIAVLFIIYLIGLFVIFMNDS
jgi:ATP-dependent Zn protease